MCFKQRLLSYLNLSLKDVCVLDLAGHPRGGVQTLQASTGQVVTEDGWKDSMFVISQEAFFNEL